MSGWGDDFLEALEQFANMTMMPPVTLEHVFLTPFINYYGVLYVSFIDEAAISLPNVLQVMP